MRSKHLVLSIMTMAAASLLFQTVSPKDAHAADLTVRVTKPDGRSSSKPSADVADGGTGGFKAGTHTLDSTGVDGVDVGTDVPLNTTHRGLTTDPHSTVSDADPPTSTEAFSGEHVFDYLEFFNGSIFETIDIDITESGGTVSLELQAEGGGDLTLNFSDGHHAFDATDPVASVALTNGDDEVPVKNWIYILQSTDVLTASAVGWPDAEHAPIATVIVQSAASVASVGAYAVHGWTDHLKDANDQGHLTDIADWIRGHYATWKSGVAPTLTITVIGGSDTVIVTTTSGEVYQLHPHDFPAFTGTPTIYVFNDNATPYNPITDLNQLTAVSDGTALSNNDYFTVTIWGVVSEDAADCKLYLNLPSGVYGNSTAALLDSSMFTNTSIPAIYKGSAFLISWYTLKYQTVDGGTFSLVAGGEVDLRGQPPGTLTGGGAGGGSSLTIEEQDASPSVPDVNAIKFPNGSLFNDGGGIVSVSISATDSAAIHDNIAGEIAAITEKGSPVSADLIIIEDSEDSNNKKRAQIGNLAGGGDMTKAVYDTDTNDIVDKAEAIPHVTSGDVTVAEGQMVQKSHEDALAVNGGGTGEVQEDALISFLDEWSFNLVNPKALFDLDTKWLITTFGPKLPNGMVIVKMTCQADADPTIEIDANFMFATGGDFIGLTGATVIIAIDSTAGEFSEDTNANFNGGNPIPAGAVIYVLIDAAPDVDTTQYGCTVTSYNPED